MTSSYLGDDYYDCEDDEYIRRHRSGVRYVQRPSYIGIIRTTLRNIANSEEGKYWTSDEKYWGSSPEWNIAWSIAISAYKTADNLRAWVRLYGPTRGLIIAAFGEKSVWEVQTKVLEGNGDEPALQFKKMVEDDSGRIGISGAIIAQAAFTALSLPNLGETHWVARASCIFSLISSLLAVYYAGSQVWSMRCLEDRNEVREWIRGGWKGVTAQKVNDSEHLGEKAIFKLLLKHAFPAPSSVVTISAPRLLLSAALKFLLIGLGVYLGFLWTKKIQISDGPHDNPNVFIVYLVGLVLCYGVYTLSDIHQSKKTSVIVRIMVKNRIFDRMQLQASESEGGHKNRKQKISIPPKEHNEQQGISAYIQQRRQEMRQQLWEQERQRLEQRVRALEQRILEARSGQEKREWALVKHESEAHESEVLT